MSILSNEFFLLHSARPPFPRWNSLRLGLTEQARLLGIRRPALEPVTDAGAAAFMLGHPALAPIQSHFVFPAGWLPPAHLSEHLLQGACGIMSVHGRASGKAQALGVDYLAALTSAMALQATLAAAVGQLRGGAFHQVRVSPLGCGLLAIGQYLAGATAPEDRERYLPGCTDPQLRPPFLSAEGLAFELEALDSAPWRKFWEAVGIAPEVAGAAWTAFLLRYAKAIAPLPAACLDALRRQPYGRIRQLAERAGIAMVPMRSVAQRRQDEGGLLTHAAPWSFAPVAGVSKASAGPDARPQHLPLQGIRVIESCRRIQGPLAGHLLALLGAEVIRLEPPGGDPLRAMPPCANGCSVRFDALNRLKTIREVDIKSAQGRETVRGLVREADVFLHNWAPGKAQELMLDAEHLHAVQPQLVYAYAGGWGAVPVAAPGTDFTVQAWTGVAEAIAMASGTHAGSLFTVLDVLGGVVASLGVVAALLRRATGGAGGRVESSLLGTADLLMQISDGTSMAGVMCGVYPTKAGLIAIDCPHSSHFLALAETLGISPAAHAGGASLLPRLALATRTASEWETVLNAHGVGACVVVEDLGELATARHMAECLDQKAYSSVNAPWSFL